MSSQPSNINSSYLSVILNNKKNRIPKNLFKCCPIAKQNFRNHYVCHKSCPCIQKYGSYLNCCYENDSPFVNTKNIIFFITYYINVVRKKFTKSTSKHRICINNSNYQMSKLYQKTRYL